jgi:hypothetical protein
LIDVLKWLFDHDPATLRKLQAELTPRYGQQPFETAIGGLLRLGFLVANRPD